MRILFFRSLFIFSICFFGLLFLFKAFSIWGNYVSFIELKFGGESWGSVGWHGDPDEAECKPERPGKRFRKWALDISREKCTKYLAINDRVLKVSVIDSGNKDLTRKNGCWEA